MSEAQRGAAVVIRGGTVFDGTADAPGRTADVLVRDGRVERIGEIREIPEGAEVVDAKGCWVTPGFIDLHTHYDAELEVSPGLTESVRHGITTVLVGSCGLSFAVGTPEDLADQFCRVEAIPRSTVLPMLERVKHWDTPTAYVEHLRDSAIGPNVTSMLGHNAVRAHVMGLGRSLDKKIKPTEREVGTMLGLLHESLDAGYLGMSFNTLSWDKVDGDRYRSKPLPSVHANWREYRSFTKVLRERDAIWQVVPNLQNRLNFLPIMLHSGGFRRKSMKTMMISMVDSRAFRAYYKIAGHLSQAINNLYGGQIRFQSLPNPFDLWVDGLEVPVIEEIGAGTEALHETDPDKRKAMMYDPAFRRKFSRQWHNPFAGRAYHRKLSEPKIVNCPDPSLIGKTFAEVAAERGVKPIDAFLDLQGEYGNDLRWYTVVGNDRPNQLAWIANHPSVLIGFSDAGAHLRNMGFYNFPLRLFKLVRDRAAEGKPVMSTERAVHRVTGEIAGYLGIDAGYLAEGRRADLVVVDPAGLTDEVDQAHEEPMEGFDGMERLVRRNNAAVRAVYVNGRLAWDGKQPGRGFGSERGFGTFLPATGTP
jgi:N-acyl-D-aspartate/D-glutamate deacylase